MNKYKNKQGGFLQLIILIIIILVLMRYNGITVYDAIDWVKNLSITGILDWLSSLFTGAFSR